MLTPRDILLLIVLPGAFAALAAAGLGWGRPGRRKAGAGAGWPAAIALAGAPLVAGLAVLRFHLTPHEALDRLRLLPALALVVSLLIGSLPRRAGQIAVALGGALAIGLMYHRVPAEGATWASLIVLAFLPGVLYFALEPLARRNPGPGLPALLLLVAIATTLVESASDSAVFGQHTIVLCSATGGLLVACAIVRRPDLSRGGLAAFLITWTMMLAFGDLCVDGVPSWRHRASWRLRRWRPGSARCGRSETPRHWGRFMVRLAAVAIPALIAAVPAAIEIVKLVQSQSEIGE